MRLLLAAARFVNRLIEPLGVRITSAHQTPERPWDETFARWVEEARGRGIDPNDIGDAEWADDPLSHALREYYLPQVGADSVVLELGPGSGRLTRHLIGRCREMILVDYSPRVGDWMAEYLAGRGRFVVHVIQKPLLSEVADTSVDVIVANGVFEHIGSDDLLWFLDEFRRVLRPGGRAVFNFDNLMSDEGLAWRQRFRGEPGSRNPFRFYHPEAIRRFGEHAGFSCVRLEAGSSRFAYVTLRKEAA